MGFGDLIEADPGGAPWRLVAIGAVAPTLLLLLVANAEVLATAAMTPLGIIVAIAMNTAFGVLAAGLGRRLFGGHGTWRTSGRAHAWHQLVIVPFCVLALVPAALADLILGSLFPPAAGSVFLLVLLVVAAWSTLMFIDLVAAAHGFSRLRAVGTILVTVGALFVVVVGGGLALDAAPGRVAFAVVVAILATPILLAPLVLAVLAFIGSRVGRGWGA